MNIYIKIAFLIISLGFFSGCSTIQNHNQSSMLDKKIRKVIQLDKKHDEVKMIILEIQNDFLKIIKNGKTDMFSKHVTPKTNYHVYQKIVGWNEGHSTFFLGIRKKGYSKDKFLSHMSRHVRLAKKNLDSIALGYFFMATSDYEIAIINWKSKESMTKMFQTDKGKEVAKDGQTFMDNHTWTTLN